MVMVGLGLVVMMTVAMILPRKQSHLGFLQDCEGN